MAIKVVGWVIIGLIFFAFIAAIAGVCFVMPYFDEKNEDERIYNPENVNAKSIKCEPQVKKEKFLDDSTQSIKRLPPIILPQFQDEKKTSTATTRITTMRTTKMRTTTMRTIKTITPPTDYKFKNITYPSNMGQKWTSINQTEPLYPLGNESENSPGKQGDKLSDFLDDLKSSSSTTFSTTVSSTEKIENTTLWLEPEETSIWLIPQKQKLINKTRV